MSELLQNKGVGKPADEWSEDFSRKTPPPMRAKERFSSPKSTLFIYTFLALGLALFIRLFIAAPYVVSGSSMEPNFDNWDYLITDRLSYRFETPSRGDVIVFHLPQEESRTLIKRVIGLPGETISVAGHTIYIKNTSYPGGFELSEPYLDSHNLGGPSGTTVTLEADEYFVLGDNRRLSSDSRSWGSLSRDRIIGRVLLRLFPLSKLGVLPAEARY